MWSWLISKMVFNIFLKRSSFYQLCKSQRWNMFLIHELFFAAYLSIYSLLPRSRELTNWEKKLTKGIPIVATTNQPTEYNIFLKCGFAKHFTILFIFMKSYTSLNYNCNNCFLHIKWEQDRRTHYFLK